MRLMLNNIMQLVFCLVFVGFGVIPGSVADHTAAPQSASLAGNFQTTLGCEQDCQPDCSLSDLQPSVFDSVWVKSVVLPGGDWQYKVALNGSWQENYGANAEADGENIPLSLPGETEVTFFYDHASHWLTDNQSNIIVTAPGNYQSALGCDSNWQPECLNTWLKDADGDGVYQFTTEALPAGEYQVKVAINLSWQENYGANGEPNGANIVFRVDEDFSPVTFSYIADTRELSVGGNVFPGNLSQARAYWLSADTLAWRPSANTEEVAAVSLVYSPEAELAVSAAGIVGGERLSLQAAGEVDEELAERFPHLRGLPLYQLPANSRDAVPNLLRYQLALLAENSRGEALDATAPQIAGVLDNLYRYQGQLGPVYRERVPSLRVWAPTARAVRLLLFSEPNEASQVAEVAMHYHPESGIWESDANIDWDRLYYQYEVEVYSRANLQINRQRVTDPYSLNLSEDSKYSQIVNLQDSDLKPPRWDKLRKPRLAAPEDIAIYELHVRDFSRDDISVPPAMRGTFKAFAQKKSRGVRHLQRLGLAGLSHVHLLPAFDCATIPENKDAQQHPPSLVGYAADSPEPQALLEVVKDQDAFNWCYDPHHFTVPEGSYASTARGTQRIYEFREMVAGLSRIGLRVIMDVVYNHTSDSLLGEKSVLDKIVPDYYHRLSDTGAIENSSCCANTASEHYMMEKLMLDSLRRWAVDYKVDGFRFDLMGHHSKQNILRARELLQGLRPEQHGVNGKQIYLYGEGWNFGEVANNARFEQATQINMGQGTGIGSFNDRIRDAVRGGGPFDSGLAHVENQGFINGLYLAPNSENSGSEAERERLLQLSDWIRIALAGSLSEYRLQTYQGQWQRAGDLPYLGQGGVAYTSDPQESINYIASHDNETLFDISQYKLPLVTPAEERLAVQNLGNSIVALAQGIPFFHAGQDLLRSKSLDRNSYNSGDWFNLLDFSFSENGWARGLPPLIDNQANWQEAGPLLADPRLSVRRRDIRRAARHLREMLAIRSSSQLFRLRTAEEIQQQVVFYNTGPQQIPGLIAMGLRDKRQQLQLLVFINARPQPTQFELPAQVRPRAERAGHWAKVGDRAHYKGGFQLHPVQRRSRDALLQTASYQASDASFTIPPRRTVVFTRRYAR